MHKGTIIISNKRAQRRKNTLFQGFLGLFFTLFQGILGLFFTLFQDFSDYREEGVINFAVVCCK